MLNTDTTAGIKHTLKVRLLGAFTRYFNDCHPALVPKNHLLELASGDEEKLLTELEDFRGRGIIKFVKDLKTAASNEAVVQVLVLPVMDRAGGMDPT